MAYDVSVRDALNQAGIDNNRIGFNKMNKSIYVDGKHSFTPQKIYQNTAYSDQATINQFLDQINKPPVQQNPVNPSPVQQTPQVTQQAPQITQQVPQVPQYVPPVYVPPQAPQIDYTPAPTPYRNQYEDIIKDIISGLGNQDEFDPYSSARYQAAEAQSNRRTEDAVRAAQEALGSAGFGRSTALADRAQGIANDESEYLMTQILPQVIAENDAKEQQEYANMVNTVSMLTGLDQRDIDNAFRSNEALRRNFESDRNFGRGVYESDRNFGRNVFESDRNFALDESGVTGQYQGQQTAADRLLQAQIDAALMGNEAQRLGLESLPQEIELNLQSLKNGVEQGQLNIEQAREQLNRMLDPNSIENQAAQLQLDTAQVNNEISKLNLNALPEQLRLQAEQARADIQRINRANIQTPEEVELARLKIQEAQARINAIQNEQSESAVDIEAEKRGLVNAIRDGSFTPGQALQRIQQDLQLGFYTPGEAETLSNLVQTLVSSNTNTATETSPEQNDAHEQYLSSIPKDNLIEDEARRLGYPTLDYRSYYKSPEGREAGLTFEQWQRLYGPTIRAR